MWRDALLKNKTPNPSPGTVSDTSSMNLPTTPNHMDPGLSTPTGTYTPPQVSPGTYYGSGGGIGGANGSMTTPPVPLVEWGDHPGMFGSKQAYDGASVTSTEFSTGYRSMGTLGTRSESWADDDDDFLASIDAGRARGGTTAFFGGGAGNSSSNNKKKGPTSGWKEVSKPSARQGGSGGNQDGGRKSGRRGGGGGGAKSSVATMPQANGRFDALSALSSWRR